MDARTALVLVTLAFATGRAAANVPLRLSVQGLLENSAGDPVEGTYDVVFHLYDAKDAEAALWTQTKPAQAVAAGRFTAVLGDGATPLGASLFDAPNGLWLGFQVGGEPELARTELLATPYAVQAARADTAVSADTAVFATQAGAAASADTATVATFLECSGCVGTLQIAASVLTAGAIAYDGAQSGLVASTVQGAIDALAVSVPLAGFALEAKLAHDLDCDGCVEDGEMSGIAAAKVIPGPFADGKYVFPSELQVGGPLTAGDLGFAGTLRRGGVDVALQSVGNRLSRNQYGTITGGVRDGWSNNTGVTWSVYRNIHTGTLWEDRDAEEQEILTAMGMSGYQHFQPSPMVVAKLEWTGALNWVTFPNQIRLVGAVTVASYCKSLSGDVLNGYWAKGMATSWKLCGENWPPYPPGTYMHAHPNATSAGSCLVIWPAVVSGYFPLDSTNPRWGYWDPLPSD